MNGIALGVAGAGPATGAANGLLNPALGDAGAGPAVAGAGPPHGAALVVGLLITLVELTHHLALA